MVWLHSTIAGEEAQQDHRREAPDALGGPLQNALCLRERARAL